MEEAVEDWWAVEGIYVGEEVSMSAVDVVVDVVKGCSA